MKLELDNISVELKKSITFNEDLSRYSWFNLGGPSQVFFRPDNLKQLSEFLMVRTSMPSNSVPCCMLLSAITNLLAPVPCASRPLILRL